MTFFYILSVLKKVSFFCILNLFYLFFNLFFLSNYSLFNVVCFLIVSLLFFLCYFFKENNETSTQTNTQEAQANLSQDLIALAPSTINEQNKHLAVTCTNLSSTNPSRNSISISINCTCKTYIYIFFLLIFKLAPKIPVLFRRILWL